MSSNKTKPPTEHRLRKARQDGQVASSADLVAALSFLLSWMVLQAGGSAVVDRLRAVIVVALGCGDRMRGPQAWRRCTGEMALELLVATLPFALAAALAAVVGVAAHGGMTFATKKLAPSFKAVDPVAGFGRVFSLRTLMEGIKTLVRLAVLAVVLTVCVRDLLPTVAGAAARSLERVGPLLWDALARFVLALGGAMFVFGVLDHRLQRWLFLRDQRMSEEDIHREQKELNGNPEIRARRREIAMEMAEQPDPAMRPSVMITNPTHYCIALWFEPGTAPGLPVVVDKKMDAQAVELRAKALLAGIPVVERPALARRLWQVEAGSPVPPDTYQAVAAVLQWVRSLNTPGLA